MSNKTASLNFQRFTQNLKFRVHFFIRVVALTVFNLPIFNFIKMSKRKKTTTTAEYLKTQEEVVARLAKEMVQRVSKNVCENFLTKSSLVKVNVKSKSLLQANKQGNPVFKSYVVSPFKPVPFKPFAATLGK